jgi:hypothetical protein
VTFEVVYPQPQPHGVRIVVGNASQVRLMTDDLHRVSASEFEVRQLPFAAAVSAAVRGRQAAAAYVHYGSTSTVYLARAAAPVPASYLQGVFARIASKTGNQPPPVVDLVPPAAGDGGIGLFFVFPLLMTGVITAIVLLQLPTWPIGRRVATVAAVGAVGATATYLTAVSLNILPSKPLQLAYAFALTQVFGQLMVGAAPPLKQYFLPAALTFALILSVPSSGGPVTPNLLPRSAISSTRCHWRRPELHRSVAYFHNADTTQPTLVMLLWAAIAAGTVAIAWLRQSRTRPTQTPTSAVTSRAGSARTLARQKWN